MPVIFRLAQKFKVETRQNSNLHEYLRNVLIKIVLIKNKDDKPEANHAGRVDGIAPKILDDDDPNDQEDSQNNKEHEKERKRKGKEI